MDEKTVERIIFRAWRTLSDPIRVVLIIMTLPTLYWLYFSISHAWKVNNNFIVSEEYYKNNIRIEGETSISSNKIDEDIKKTQILYNYYSIITYLGNSAILAATLLATEIGLFFAYRWNRKKSAFDTLNSIILGQFLNIRNEIELLGINPYDINSNYLTDRQKIKKKIQKSEIDFINNFLKMLVIEDEVSQTTQNNRSSRVSNTYLVRDILNTFDLISTGIKYGVIDEEMAFQQLRYLMFAYWRWANPYILLCRMFAVHSTEINKCYDCKMFSDFEDQIYLWEKRERKTELDLTMWKNGWKDSIREEVKEIFEQVQRN